jgi:phosphatidylserine/phosphatidylglycerophosphate/cardiolipin synthase-like enzyme
MNPDEIERFLAQTLADRKLTGSEKESLADWLAKRAPTDQQRGMVRHVAFELARKTVADPEAVAVIGWLEGVLKVVAPVAHEPGAGTPSSPGSSGSAVFFAPGDGCWQHIVARLRAARHTADLCVFTITDDRISGPILDTHRRGVKVRVISDAEKAHDLGSDIGKFQDAGIAVKLARVAAPTDPGLTGHMHHKFALFDGGRLLAGSYNWTRGAANVNYEDLIDTADPPLVATFAAEFERLWAKF